MTFLVFNPATGAITGFIECSADQDESVTLAHNTPSGMALLAVPDNSPAIADPKNWVVQSGKLVAKT